MLQVKNPKSKVFGNTKKMTRLKGRIQVSLIPNNDDDNFINSSAQFATANTADVMD